MVYKRNDGGYGLIEDDTCPSKTAAPQRGAAVFNIPLTMGDDLL